MISFLAFFLMWAERMNWDVPDCHYRACHWLEHRGNLAVLRCFRGFGKSTILGVYNASTVFCISLNQIPQRVKPAAIRRTFYATTP